MACAITIIAFLTLSRAVIMGVCVATVEAFAVCSEGILEYG